MQTKQLLVIIGIALAVGLGLAFYTLRPSTTQASLNKDSSALITEDVIYGKPLEEWAQGYWNWSIGVPTVDQMDTDPKTGMTQCYVGSDSDGRMAYLFDPYDAKYETTCEISSTTAILVPLLISECDALPENTISPEKLEDSWACAQEYNEVFSSWDVMLDGKTIFRKVGNEEVNSHLADEILVRNSSKFTWNIPENNRFDFEPGTTEAVVDGYYMIFKPLTPGDHLLKYKITHEQRSPGADLSYVYGDVTYHLKVIEVKS